MIKKLKLPQSIVGSIKFLLHYIFAVIILNMLTIQLIRPFIHEPPTNSTTTLLLLFSLAFFNYLIVMLITNKKNFSIKQINKNYSIDKIVIGLKTGIFLYVLSFLLNVIMSFTILKNSNDAVENTKALIESGPFIGILIAVIGAPIFEELFFRYHLRTLIHNSNVYLIMTTIFFGISHAQNFDNPIILTFSVLWTGFLGFICAKLYLKTNWIGTSIIAHSIYNFTLLTVAFLMRL